jgi:hypothetical protein
VAGVFGLRQSLDTLGAFIGPISAIGLMPLTANSFTSVFWIAVTPGFIVFALLLVGVEGPAKHIEGKAKPPLRLADTTKRLSATY